MLQLKSDITDIGERVSHMKNKMGEFTTAHNELVDSHYDHEEEMQTLKQKIADLEDRSRRNNSRS